MINKIFQTLNKRQWLIDSPRATLGIFIILNIMAMAFYKGGTYHNASSPGYSFFNNFLSDLGRVVSHSGQINFHASLCFNMAMLLAGFTLSMFFLSTPYLFKLEEKRTYFISIIASFFGILGSLSMIGVGFTPSDIFFQPHVLFAHWLFRFLFLAALLTSICIYKSKKFNNKYAFGYIVFSITIFSYVLFNELGPSPHINPWALYLQAISQKAILLCFFISVVIQTNGISLLFSNEK